MPAAPVLRPIAATDRAMWETLWQGYLDFYEVRLDASVTDRSFSRIAAGEGIHGLIALAEDGAPLGFSHYIFHASTWSAGGYCYLEDLFVTKAARGLGLGRALIAATEEAARGKGASRLYWHTEEFNGTARRLYERLAKRAPFLRYQIAL